MQIETSEINLPGGGGFKPPRYKKLYLFFLLVIVFFLGVQFGRSDINLPENKFTQVFIEKNRENASKDVDWQLLWDAVEEIQNKYVDRPADMLKILYGAVSGAVQALEDPYSVFLPPKKAEEFKNELKGNFEGIGAEIAIKNELLVVVTPLDGSPAQKAGVRAGDFIYKVDEAETRGLTIEEAVAKIRGPAGTQVLLIVFHKGATKPTEIKITRAKIEIKSLSFEIRESGGKKIGILKLRRFGDETQGEVEKAINEFLLRGIEGVIFDLRNNPGGFIDSAIEVASNWVKEGEVVVIQRYGNGMSDDVYKAEGGNRLAGMPTVILLNGGSASASEIVAGALRDHGLAKLVGEKSFGKGSVQEIVDLRGSAQIKLTIAKWLTPKGHDLNKEGLEPDEKVELTDEDFQNDRDPQLDRALDILAQN